MATHRRDLTIPLSFPFEIGQGGENSSALIGAAEEVGEGFFVLHDLVLADSEINLFQIDDTITVKQVVVQTEGGSSEMSPLY